MLVFVFVFVRVRVRVIPRLLPLSTVRVLFAVRSHRRLWVCLPILRVCNPLCIMRICVRVSIGRLLRGGGDTLHTHTTC